MVESSIELVFDMAKIVAVIASPALLLGSVSILALKQWRGAAVLGVCGMIALVTFLARPDVLKCVALVAALPEVLIHLACLAALLAIASAALVIYFLPSIVAAKRGIPDRDSILLKNALMGWLPLGWNIILYRAFAEKRVRSSHRDSKLSVRRTGSGRCSGGWDKVG